MTTLRALLVDDERLARKRLAALLAAHPQVAIVGEADGFEAALAMAEDLRPDVVFLDVEMPPANGLALVTRLPKQPAPPAVVFVTAHESFAVEAFAVSAFDYLLKPVHPDRLAMTLRRLAAARPDAAAASPRDEAWTSESRITLADGHTLRMVAVREIVAIRALGTYSQVSSSGQPPMTVLRSISDWERRLPAKEFLRLDRSLIVQPRRLRLFDRRSRDQSLLSLEGLAGPLEIGRAAAVRLRRHLDG